MNRSGVIKMRNLILTAILLASPYVATAHNRVHDEYNQMGMSATGLGEGYKDKLQSDGTYKITANSGPRDDYHFARDMALYHSAEIVTQLGYEYFQVIDAKFKIGVSGLNVIPTGFESVQLVIRPSHTTEAPQDCKAKEPRNCVALSAIKIMSAIRPSLNFPK